MRCTNPDKICGFCAEFTRQDIEPEYAELGMGRCHGFDTPTSPKVYVPWNGEFCVLFVRDIRSVPARRRFVESFRAKEAA